MNDLLAIDHIHLISRDAHAAATHRWVSHSLYQDLGAIILGHDAGPEFAGTGGPGLGARRSN